MIFWTIAIWDYHSYPSLNVINTILHHCMTGMVKFPRIAELELWLPDILTKNILLSPNTMNSVIHALLRHSLGEQWSSHITSLTIIHVTNALVTVRHSHTSDNFLSNLACDWTISMHLPFAIQCMGLFKLGQDLSKQPLSMKSFITGVWNNSCFHYEIIPNQ